MEKAFKEMDFEWEFLHPKGSLLADEQQQLNLNCFSSNDQVMEENQPFAPIADEELSDESMMGTEEICQEQAQLFHEKLVMDEDADFEESMDFEESDEDVYDWGLKDLFIKDEEEEELGKMAEDSCNAFGLKKWLRSIGVAAATLSIFMLGGGRAQLIRNNQKIQLPICTKAEKIKDSVQHKRASSPSFSWCGHYDERF